MTDQRIVDALAWIDAFSAREEAKSHEPELSRGADFYHAGVAFGLAEAARHLRLVLEG